MSTLPATWQLVTSTPRLQRPSQCLSAIGDKAYILGGELRPREPVDSQVDVVALKKTAKAPVVNTLTANAEVPSPRVGTASAVVQSELYLYSGRGGVSMAPVEEEGAIWKYTPLNNAWTKLSPADTSATYPQARSYHAMTSDGDSKLYLHAGCPEQGRLSDLWSFDITSRVWTELAAAPDPPRGGTSMTWLGNKLWRMNGFDSKNEQGGAMDVYDPGQNEWSTITYVADNQAGPGPRSVGSLVPIVANGRNFLLTLFGEQDPSSLGHAGAGKMQSDVWVFDVESHQWMRLAIKGNVAPQARGWFAADVSQSGRRDTVVVHGGLAEDNSRLGDVWTLVVG